MKYTRGSGTSRKETKRRRTRQRVSDKTRSQYRSKIITNKKMAAITIQE